jgi:ABC-type branched-subunit amino acid transport system permease subunit
MQKLKNVWLGLILVVLAGCAGAVQGLIVSGVTLRATGDQFVVVATAFKQGCDVTKTIPQPDCQKFRIFGEKFKLSYPLAVSLWEIARKAGDPGSETKAAEAITLLASELTSFAVMVIQKEGK